MKKRLGTLCGLFIANLVLPTQAETVTHCFYQCTLSGITPLHSIVRGVWAAGEYDSYGEYGVHGDYGRTASRYFKAEEFADMASCRALEGQSCLGLYYAGSQQIPEHEPLIRRYRARYQVKTGTITLASLYTYDNTELSELAIAPPTFTPCACTVQVLSAGSEYDGCLQPAAHFTFPSPPRLPDLPPIFEPPIPVDICLNRWWAGRTEEDPPLCTAEQMPLPLESTVSVWEEGRLHWRRVQPPADSLFFSRCGRRRIAGIPPDSGGGID